MRNVFDTQVAAGFAGMAAQASYETLLAELLGVRLAKSASFTRWDARPLSTEQLAYAREDVVHLLELAGELRAAPERLRAPAVGARGVPRARESQRRARRADAIFARLPRIRNLSAVSQAVARELVAWRERTAAREGPHRAERARRRGAGRDRQAPPRLDARAGADPRRRPGQPAPQRRRAAGGGPRRRRTADGPQIPLERLARGGFPDPADAPLVALCEALVRARAREADLAYELIAARADLQAVVAAVRTGAPEPDVRTLRGWRRELVGAELLELLDGRLSLSVREGSCGSAVTLAP